MQKKNFLLSRVDVQVSLLAALIAFSSTWVTNIIFQKITYELMLLSLEDRVYALYDVIERDLCTESFFLIDNPYDMNSDLYIQEKEKLFLLKEATGVKYLYTAKKNVHDRFVYVIDGLSSDDDDFRRPGDAIEEEISSTMHRALMGEHIIPDSVMETEWGQIFITYLPIHNDMGAIIGVVGIEFAAEEISHAYEYLIQLAPVIVIIFTFLASVASFITFRRISNPFYMDLANTDTPTRLKNRNAFEVDMNNFISRAESAKIGLVMIDLNHLKKINDRYGHSWGDDFIKLVADSIQETRTIDMIAYRTGGDEFIIIVENATEKAMNEFIYQCSGMVKNQRIYPDLPTTISCGWAIFDPRLDKTLKNTLERADIAMYHNKRTERTLI